MTKLNVIFDADLDIKDTETFDDYVSRIDDELRGEIDCDTTRDFDLNNELAAYIESEVSDADSAEVTHHTFENGDWYFEGEKLDVVAYLLKLNNNECGFTVVQILNSLILVSRDVGINKSTDKLYELMDWNN